MDISPADAYRARLRERQQTLHALNRRDTQISTARGLVFLGFLLLWWRIQANPELGEVALLAPILLFVALLLLHARLRDRREQVTRALQHYQAGLDRVKGRIAGDGKDGGRYRDSDHPYANDLDLFGPNSIFQLLNRCQTRLGEDRLADWLKAPAERAEILARQAAIEELRPRLDLREAMDVIQAPIRETANQNQLTLWLSHPSREVSPRLLWASGLLSLTAMAGLLIEIPMLGGRYTLPLAIFAVQVVLLFWHREQLHAEFASTEQARNGLSVAIDTLRLIERTPVTAPRLQEIQTRLEVEGVAPSTQMARLLRLLNRLNNCMMNQFFAPIAILFGLHFQILARIHRWKEHVGPAVPNWLESIGEWEVLLSLSGHAFEFPDSKFPDLAGEEALFEGSRLVHPILARGSCVANDVRLTREEKLLLVSGSNMSGKSTLLRTVGVNTVLALAGGVVHAESLRLSVFQVGAAMRVSDSLQDGKSLFYAVVTRLKQIVDLADGPQPLLYLIDEILPGTNSHDRRLGAEGVLRNLIGRNALGLVTTHDLALTKISESLGGRAVNVHFEDHLENGKMTFDYQLRPGVVQKSNALELMKMIGLEIGDVSRAEAGPSTH
jgi:hypothetical protein